ncbi:baseplate protein [Leclercia adecarboxylata]|uniref:baseplate protein n=1 Tax=Leclercia adecarboxylata TaxID=83655 RepID=UPI00111A4B46|nr:baseplate protein [Leclercia adecarboxylata]QCZ30193.1 baseplate protein [Leclercia adecarboxylata]QFH68053.1 baseplate protein [Leclercia adecarboxylata]
MSYNRLDDRTIDDPVLLALFHQEVIARATSYNADNFQYTIKPDEVQRSDLCAFRAYENADLRWVFRLLVGHEAETENMPVGTTLTLPAITWLRDRMRDYTGAPELASG